MNLTLAAGNQIRWQNGNTSGFDIKQLIVIDGETLIERIQRQFGGRVVTHNLRIMEVSEYVFKPEHYRWTVETLLSTRELWRGQVIITLGDVYYTDWAVMQIKEFAGPIMFFGTLHEIFAISFNDYARVEACLLAAVKRLERMTTYPSHGKLHQLYRRYHGYDTNVARIDKNFTLIDDRTQDFDDPEDLSSFYEKN